MYIERLRRQPLKKKLESRETLTALEYINAFISMLRDKRLQKGWDHQYMFAHLHDVTQDAQNRPWAEVRQWSQCVFDAVEAGRYQWDDLQEIQNERFRMALPRSYVSHTQPTQPSQTDSLASGSRAREVVCADFNSDKGCSATVTGFKDRAHHICSYCMAAASQRQPHSVVTCYRRDRHRAANTGPSHTQSQYPVHQSNPQGQSARTHYGFQQYTSQVNPPQSRQYNPQVPKNGQ